MIKNVCVCVCGAPSLPLKTVSDPRRRAWRAFFVTFVRRCFQSLYVCMYVADHRTIPTTTAHTHTHTHTKFDRVPVGYKRMEL